jgi:hypothetical protein
MKHASGRIFLALFATLWLSACGPTIANAPALAPPLTDKPPIVFTIDWDYSSPDHLIAWPIVVYDDGRFREPPCTGDKRQTAEFRHNYLAPGRNLFVLRGGEVIGSVAITMSPFPEETGCYALVVQVDMPDVVADALEARGNVLLAVTELPPDQPEAPPEPAGEALAEAEDSVIEFLLGNGVTEEIAWKMQTEAWIVSAKRRDMLVTSYAFVEEVGADEDFHSLLMLRRRDGDIYRPIFIEYERTAPERESEYCFAQFIDALNLSRRNPETHIFAKYRCNSGVAHGVYGPNGGRLYSGSFYGS